jgi:quaternary ammonium compound-resistance protein SugE
MAWIYLLAAGACEVVWAIGLKKYGFWPVTSGSVVTIVVMVLSFLLLAQAMKDLPLGTSYAIWTGIGAVGAAAYGIAQLGEPRDWRRIVCMMLIVLGILGLKLLTPQRA